MAEYRCPYGYGWCEVPYKDCPHWQGTFCELDVEAEKMDELKPCPFCGGKARWYEKNKAPQCSKCLATIPSGGSILRKWFDESGYREYMVALWNRRAGEEGKHD